MARPFLCLLLHNTQNPRPDQAKSATLTTQDSRPGTHKIPRFGKLAYWQTLRDFWTAYFQKTGANLRAYSILREQPNLGSSE